MLSRRVAQRTFAIVDCKEHCAVPEMPTWYTVSGEAAVTRQPCTEKQPSTYSRLSMSTLPAGATFSNAAACVRGST